MRVKILFWNYNINKGDLMLEESRKGDPLARIVKRHEVDVFILADCQLPTEDVLDSLSAVGLDFSETVSPHKMLRFFRRSSGPDLVPVLSDDRLSFFRLAHEGFEEVSIGATHLYGRRDVPTPESRHAKVDQHYKRLIEVERMVGHKRTLLLGDFNMTPDEMGMVDPEHAFGALMTWDLAVVHSDPKYGGSPRFYNPMWSLMGRAEAPGTYFWPSTDPYNRDFSLNTTSISCGTT